MKLLIAGSRSITQVDLSLYVPAETELIISGGAKGVDSIAEEFADSHKISKLILRPEYQKYKRAAPLIRNEKMIDICDKILVFWDGKSRGTKYTIDYAKKNKKQIEIVIIAKKN